jgi:hypothetical protein
MRSILLFFFDDLKNNQIKKTLVFRNNAIDDYFYYFTDSTLGLTVKGNSSSVFEIPQGAMLTVTQLSLADAKGTFSNIFLEFTFTDGEAASVQLAVEIEGFEEDSKAETKNFQVARLIAGKTDQIKVNFKLFCHEPSSVNVKGAGTVHLVGYLEPDPNFPDVNTKKLNSNTYNKQDSDDELDEEDEEALREQMMGGLDSDEDGKLIH